MNPEELVEFYIDKLKNETGFSQDLFKRQAVKKIMSETIKMYNNLTKGKNDSFDHQLIKQIEKL